MSEFKQEDLFETNQVSVDEDQSFIKSRELSLILNDDNHFRKYYLASSGSKRLNIIRLLSLLISVLLIVNVAPCDQVMCLILSGIGIGLVIICLIWSRLNREYKKPLRSQALLTRISGRVFIEEKHVEYQEQPKPWVDAHRTYLEYASLKCPMDWFMDGEETLNLRDCKFGVIQKDQYLGEHLCVSTVELLRNSSVSKDMSQSLNFIKMIDKLGDKEKKRLHLKINGVEIDYKLLIFRLFPMSAGRLKELRAREWMKEENERLQRVNDENRRRVAEKNEINARKRLEIIRLNAEIEEENKRLHKKYEEDQSRLDEEYLKRLSEYVDNMTKFSRLHTTIKVALLITCLMYSCLVFSYKTSCDSKFCGYTGLGIFIIVPFELYVWMILRVNLNISSGLENVDKGVIIKQSTSTFNVAEDGLGLMLDLQWNKMTFDFFAR